MKKLGNVSLGVCVSLCAVMASPAQAKSDTKVNLDLSSALFAGKRDVSGDFEDSNRSSARASADLSIDHEWDANAVQFEIGSGIVEYFDKDQRDRWSNHVSLNYVRELVDDLRLSVGGAYATQLIGLEHDKFDQSQVRSMLAYQSGANRFRVGGGYRWRDYDDAGDTDGEGYFVDVDYRRRFGRAQYASLDVVFDRINADVRTRDYSRVSITPAYRFPIGKKTELELSSRWRRWSYDHRYLPSGRRVDHSIQPTIHLTHEFARDWNVDLEAAWRHRWSKDPQGDESGPRGMIGVSRRFRLND